MMDSQLHCLYGFLFSYENLKHNKQRRIQGFSKPWMLNVSTLVGWNDMCRGSNVKDKQAIAFQLESLILAQNERWRHA